MAKISVCIPTYNGEKYIKEQIESILCQIGDNDEIIISDDNSTDKTINILKSYNDDRVKIFSHEKIENNYRSSYKNIYYVYKNVENALSKATGDYIFLSDQDDIWMSNKVNTVIESLDMGYDCVLHNATVVDNNLNVLLESYFSWSKPSKNIFRFILRCFYQGASMAFTKEVKSRVLPMPNNLIGHDHWIACNAKNTKFIKEPLIWYRRHNSNVSFSTEKSSNPLWFKILYRFRLIYAILIAQTRKNNI